MRHQKSGKQLGRNSAHRKALFNNLVTALLTYGRIETTEAKAKELRRFADSTIAWGVSVHGLLAKGDQMSQVERAKVLHARRQARKTVTTKGALERLFSEVGPALAARPGGYTRVLKSRIRKGDAAPMALVEIVGLDNANA
jgi:large subunit ribosomal protein L17